MSASPLAAAIACAVLAGVHLATPRLRFLSGTPRSIWLSIAGGVSVAYVFVHLLPELAEGQPAVSRAAVGAGILVLERHVYLIALTGLAVFYGLDKFAKRGRTEGGATSAGVFRVHIASFGMYNALIGYLLLHREATGLRSLVFFAVAMALHFVVTDFGLNDDHQAQYRGTGQWVLVASLVAGLIAGALTEIPEAAIAALVAFLAGGVILNVLKEEVPGERRGRFWAFAVGMAGYAALLLAL